MGFNGAADGDRRRGVPGKCRDSKEIGWDCERCGYDDVKNAVVPVLFE